MQTSLRKIWVVTGVVSASIIILLAGLGLWLYNGSLSSAKLSILKVVNLPVGTVGDVQISARDVAVYEQLAPVMKKSGNELLLDALKLQFLAEGNNVEVSRRELEEAAETLQTDPLYIQAIAVIGQGSSRDLIAKPYALDAKLRAWYASQAATLEPALAQNLQTVQLQLDRGTAFAEVAQLYSEDTATNQFAGDAGYVNLNDALPEFRDAVTLLDKNKRTVVYTRYGIHIVEVLDEITHEGKRLVNLREIVLRSKNYDSWLAKEKQAVPVSWYIK